MEILIAFQGKPGYLKSKVLAGKQELRQQVQMKDNHKL
jgi:hypothetical protein